MNSKHFRRRDFVKGGIIAGAVGGGVPAIAGGSASYTETASLLTTTRVVRIPTDYPTLQAAVLSESRWLPNDEARVVLHIESGYRIPSGVTFWNGSYGHFIITSDDDVVNVADEFSDPLISVRRAIGPVLATMIDMRGRGGNGYWCENAFGYIENADRAGKICGIRNAGHDGILSAHGGNMRLGDRDESDLGEETGLGAFVGRNPLARRAAEVSGSGRYNIHCAVGAFVSARSAILTNAKKTNVYCSHTGMIACDGADCSGAAEYGVYVNGSSQIDAAGVTAVNCGRFGLSAARCATMRATGAVATGSGTCDISVRHGGMMDVTGVRTTNGTPAVEDTNLANFNTVYGQGILFNENV